MICHRVELLRGEYTTSIMITVLGDTIGTLSITY